VTVVAWVYFFLGVSVLSLIVAMLFTREAMGFLKRHYKTVAALLVVLGAAACVCRLRSNQPVMASHAGGCRHGRRSDMTSDKGEGDRPITLTLY